jgi:hypothetical protein
MASDRTARLAVPAAAALLLWPAVWNGYPIVFADTGTYLSQAIHLYAGWDRPVFYSLFMLPLHLTVTLWPVVVAQALLAAWVLWLVCRVLVPRVSGLAFAGGMFVLSACTWLPWLVCELMPDLFTPLLVLVLCLLAWVPERLSRIEQVALAGLATLMIASQQSSVPLACGLLAVLVVVRSIGSRVFFHVSYQPAETETFWHRPFTVMVGPRVRRQRAGSGPPSTSVIGQRKDVDADLRRRDGTTADLRRHDGATATAKPSWAAGPTITGVFARPPMTRDEQSHFIARLMLIVLPPALALLSLCSVNLAAHGRFAVSPFGNIFLLARVTYDGPGMAVLRHDCPAVHWRLCPFLDDFPPLSDDFLWTHDSPLNRAGGPKIVSRDAGGIIQAAVLADPVGEARAALANTLEQMTGFASGDGLNPWPAQVSPTIERYFPAREQAAYASARQQARGLSVPPLLSSIHMFVALTGVAACVLLLPIAFLRRATCAGFLLAVLLALPLSAAITGALSGPHDRYQARIMWLPPFVAAVSFAALRRRSA